jgi:hypothetical protein
VLVAIVLKLPVSVRCQHATARQIFVDQLLSLVYRPGHGFGDLRCRGANLGEQGRGGAAVVVEVQIASANLVRVLAPVLVEVTLGV